MVERIEQEPQGDGGQSDRNLAPSPSLSGGWVKKEGEPENMYTAAPLVNSTTPDFSKFSESSRARWDLLELLKAKFKQRFNKK
ncbi:MAG: hypothetical protein Q7T59_01400 [Candidatus Woesebacteria bacterium]|nr:hypothetical protein [Candidatus Woesebacteria bacterium]